MGASSWQPAAALILALAWVLGMGVTNRRQPIRATLVIRSRLGRPGALAPEPAGAGRLLGLAGRFKRRWRRRSVSEDQRSAALEVLAAFAAELRAGQPVRVALERACAAAPQQVCTHAIGVARLGGDVPRALQRDARDQGLPLLRSLAALWQVAEGSGAGLAQAVDRLCIAEANNEQVRRSLTSELAGPKATAKVLAGLPVVGLFMGSGLGASPVSWLLGSSWGIAVLAAGVALEGIGLWWTSRLTRSVELLL